VSGNLITPDQQKVVIPDLRKNAVAVFARESKDEPGEIALPGRWRGELPLFASYT
jgi:hypothetical protein